MTAISGVDRFTFRITKIFHVDYLNSILFVRNCCENMSETQFVDSNNVAIEFGVDAGEFSRRTLLVSCTGFKMHV